MLPLNENLSTMTLSGIRRFTGLAAQTPGCISLALGEPDFPTPEPIQAAAKAALEENLTHYAPNRGCRSFAGRFPGTKPAWGMIAPPIR